MQAPAALNTLEVNFPVPPPASMPEPLQTIFFWLTAVLALLVLGYSIWLAKKHESAVPVLLVLAAAAAIPLEPIVGFLGHVIHPADGSIKMFAAVDRVIPWHMGFAYTAAFGAIYLALYLKISSGKGVPSNYVWVTYAISVAAYIVIEIYPVSAGLWVYYDNQPLWLWRGMAPLPWSFLNSASEIMGITLVYMLLPYLRGWRQGLIILLGPMGALMAHLGSGWPMYSIMNSSAAQSFWLLQGSGLLSIALAIVTTWICVIILARPQTTI